MAWDSSEKRKAFKCDVPNLASQDSEAQTLKAEGNRHYKEGRFAEALACYAQGIQTLTSESAGSNEFKDLLSVLLSNAGAAALRLGRPAEAVELCSQAAALRPTWTKPLLRLAEAYLSQANFAAAVAVCLKGESLCIRNSEGHTEFTPLLDRIAVEGAARGNLAAFTGRRLEVRSAGEEAWLGRPAPHVPALDGPLTEETCLPSDDVTVASGVPTAPAALLPGPGDSSSQGAALSGAAPSLSARSDALATWHYADSITAFKKHRTSFRCIKEALAAAKDGDLILMRKGTHNGMGECVTINKRVIIHGEGSLGATVIDQRANVPTFRFVRGGAVVRNLDLDQTGFREAVLVDGPATVAPLIEQCIIKCSGDNAVDVGGGASPLLRGCTITGKKCGVMAFGTSRPRLEACMVEKCGEQGVRAMENACVEALQTTVRDCAEDGVVVCGSAAVKLVACTIQGNKGPGVDCSDAAKAEISGGSIVGNVGGVWLWGNSSAAMDGVRLDGGPAQVILADGGTTPSASKCSIKGTVHATDAAWEGLFGRGNTFLDPEQPTDFPPEEGPFRFVPNPYTRKM